MQRLVDEDGGIDGGVAVGRRQAESREVVRSQSVLPLQVDVVGELFTHLEEGGICRNQFSLQVSFKHCQYRALWPNYLFLSLISC